MIKIYQEINSVDELIKYLYENTWSGGRDRVNAAKADGTLKDKATELYQLLNEYYPKDVSDVQVNDIVWFDDIF